MEMPKNITYVFIVHAGSYKDFNKKIGTKFPDLQVRFEKRKAVHYYIMQVEEVNTDTQAYDKDTIYSTLPIMAMREEFSNFIFFKGTKGYNNVLKLMLNGKENKQAPYNLFQEMLTVHEKYMAADAYNIQTYGKDYKLCFEKKEREAGSLKEDIVTKSFFGNSVFDDEAKVLMFEAQKIKMGDKEFDFAQTLTTEQKLTIGII